MTFTQICPRCKSPNACGFTEDPSISGCWCTKINMPAAVLNFIQKEYRETSCLCKACLLDLIADLDKEAAAEKTHKKACSLCNEQAR